MCPTLSVCRAISEHLGGSTPHHGPPVARVHLKPYVARNSPVFVCVCVCVLAHNPILKKVHRSST